MKNKKRLYATAAALVMMFTLCMSVYAAWDDFTISLPTAQGDYELPRVQKTSTITCFSVKITDIGTTSDDYDTVMVWTEKPSGDNYSSATYEAGLGKSNPPYDEQVPEVGDNVVLNMDNPIYTTDTPVVSGEWTPY